MADQEPTFWRIDSRLGWHTASVQDVAAGEINGLRLDAARQNGRGVGPFSLDWKDGSLGATLLPKGMAVSADGQFFLVDPAESLVKRYDAHQQAFVPLPGILAKQKPSGGQPEYVEDEKGRKIPVYAAGRALVDGRTLNHPVAVAVSAGLLYVVDDAERRVQVFSTNPPYLLVYLWSRPGWNPVDVASWGGDVYVLDADAGGGRVFRQRAGSDELHPFIHQLGPGRWTRLAVDHAGRLNLLDEATPRVVRYDPHGRRLAEEDILDAGAIRDNFDAPPLRLRYRTLKDDAWSGRFRLPPSLAGSAASGDLPVFDRAGRPAELSADDPLGPYLYARRGSWTSGQLDSGIYRCQWHRIELELAQPLPPGSKVTVSTFSSDALLDQSAPDALWAVGGSFLGQFQQGQPDPLGTLLDTLVLSREGQYLAVRVELEGDGYSTPEIRALRVHYPRSSYLNYLPAVYQADDTSRWFLERFLSIFQTEWDGLEAQIEDMTALFDPAAVPAGALDQLAAWIGLPLEGTWNTEQKRAMLKAVPQIYPRRGTSASLRRYLQVYLGNISGAQVEKQPDFPLLVEGFRERQRVILAAKQGIQVGAQLNQGALLWGPAQVGRLQLDVYATEGDVKLVSTGDPERDMFYEYAHRFRIFVPAAWVRTAQDETMLRRAIEAEKPAQAAYDLCLVEARFQVGVQSLVGINTIIGQMPAARLACAEQEKNAPPSQAPHGRLGYDTVLSAAIQPAGSIYQIAQ